MAKKSRPKNMSELKARALNNVTCGVCGGAKLEPEFHKGFPCIVCQHCRQKYNI